MLSSKKPELKPLPNSPQQMEGNFQAAVTIEAVFNVTIYCELDHTWK